MLFDRSVPKTCFQTRNYSKQQASIEVFGAKASEISRGSLNDAGANGHSLAIGPARETASRRRLEFSQAAKHEKASDTDWRPAAYRKLGRTEAHFRRLRDRQDYSHDRSRLRIGGRPQRHWRWLCCNDCRGTLPLRRSRYASYPEPRSSRTGFKQCLGFNGAAP